MKKYLILALLSTQLVKAQMPPICFDTASTYTLAPAWGSDLVSEDFNGDSIPDIATSDISGYQVLLYVGNGNGSFNGPVNGGFPTQDYPKNLVAADFNLDGKMDLVTVNSLSSSISLLLGTGTGSFLPQQVFSVGNYPRGITNGDYNNDGKMDIVTANYTAGSISVLMGTGTGSFQSPISYSALQGAEAVTTGDFNNDGNQDIALCVWTSSLIKVYYGNGNGTFQLPVNNAMYTFDNYPEALTAADLNNDGFDDLVIHDALSSVLSIFMGNATNTLSSYNTLGTTLPGGNVTKLAVADINGDGNKDIVIPKTNIYLGTGTGSFLASATYTNFWGNSVIAKDFNRDGKNDLGYVTSNMQIVMNMPLVKITGVPGFVCPGATLNLVASGATSYTWNTGQTGTLISVSPNISTNYTVTGGIANGCKTKAIVGVMVKTNPDSADLAFMNLSTLSPDTVCAGDQVTMCVNGAQTFSWSTGLTAPCLTVTPFASTVYSVTAKGNGCSKTMSRSVNVEACVGIRELKKEDVLVFLYPNPGSGLFYVEAHSDLDLSVMTAQGKELTQYKIGEGSQELDLRDYAEGLYLLVFRSRSTQQQEIKKVVLQH